MCTALAAAAAHSTAAARLQAAGTDDCLRIQLESSQIEQLRQPARVLICILRATFKVGSCARPMAQVAWQAHLPACTMLLVAPAVG
jgi:hypothetical protein